MILRASIDVDGDAATQSARPSLDQVDKLPPLDEPGPQRIRRGAGVLRQRLADPRQRGRLAPLTAAAAVAAAGLALDPGWAFGATAGAGAGLMLLRARRITGKLGLAYAAVTAGFASAWSAQIAVHGGISWPGRGDAYLVAAAAVLAVPHAHRNRWRYDPPDLDLLPELDSGEEVTEFQDIFSTYVATGGRASWRLTPEWDVPNGQQADVIVPRGESATEDILAAAKIFRSAWDKSPTQVHLEETPDRRATRARLTVLREDVLADNRVWTGATLDPATGLAVVGSYPDGQLTHLQFFAPRSGTVDTFIAGTKGSGKSRFLDKTAAEVHLTPLGVLFINDPQEGQSLSEWIDAAADYAMGGLEHGYDRCLKQLRAFRRIVYRRSSYHTHEIQWIDDRGRERKGRKTFFEPTPDLPFVYDLLDEVHVLVKNDDPDIRKETLYLLGEIAKLSRKTGAGLAYVTHTPSQEEMGGQAAGVIRLLLREGNVVAFRTAEAVAHHMLGLTADPSKLPPYFADGSKTHGLGLIKGFDRREGPFRAEYVADPYAIAQHPAAGRLDAMSLEAMAEPDDRERAPKTFIVPGLKRPSILPTAEEKQTWAERVLAVFTDGGDRTLGAVIKAFPGDASDRSIRWGLKKLVADGLLETDGPKRPYRITDAGRAELERRQAVA